MFPTAKQLIEAEILMQSQFGDAREDYVEGLKFALKVMGMDDD